MSHISRLLTLGTLALIGAVTILGQEAATNRSGHAGEITTVAISPDSKLIASGGKDGTVRIWDAASGREIARLMAPPPEGAEPQAEPSVVNCVRFSPNGSILAVAFENGTYTWASGEWTRAPKKELSSSNHGFLAFSPDNRRLAMAERNDSALSGFPSLKLDLPGLDTTPELEIWDFSEEDVADTIRGAYGPVAFHPNGKIIAYTSEGGSIFIDSRDSDVEAKGRKLKADNDRVATLTFDKTGEYLYSLAGGGLLSVGGVRTWRSSDHTLGSKYSVRSDDLILAHPDGKNILIAGDQFSQSSLVLINPMTGAVATEISRTDANVRPIAAISQDGKTIVAVDKNDHDIQIIDLLTGKIRSTLKGHTIFVWSLAFTSDDKTLVTGYDDGTLIAWDPKTGKMMNTVKTEKSPEPATPFLFLRSDDNGDVVLSPDAKRYLIGRSANKIYDGATGKSITKITEPTAGSNTAFSPNGNLVAVSENKVVRISDTSTGKLIKKFPVVGDKGLTPTNTAFGPDGTTIAVCGAALTYRDVATGRIKKPIIGGTGCVDNVAISPDGKYLLSAMADSIAAFSLSTGRIVYKIKDMGLPPDFAISPDSKLLAVALHSGTLELFDLATGKQIYSIESAFTSEMGNFSMTFSHDGKWIALGTDHGTFIFGAGDGSLAAI